MKARKSIKSWRPGEYYLAAMTMNLFLAFSNAASVVASPQSILDPYATISAPSGKMAKPAVSESRAETSTTYITIPMDGKSDGKSNINSVKKAQHPKVTHHLKSSSSTVSTQKNNATKGMQSAGDTLVSGTKAAGAKIANGTKVVKDGMAAGTKKMGDGITAGAKLSSTYFMKSAKALGTSMKTAGVHIKDGSQSVESKVSSLPRLLHGGKKEPRAESIVAEKNETKHALAATRTKPSTAIANTPGASGPDPSGSNSNATRAHAAASPIPEVSKISGNPDKISNNKGIVSKTLSKLNFLGHNKDNHEARQTASANSLTN